MEDTPGRGRDDALAVAVLTLANQLGVGFTGVERAIKHMADQITDLKDAVDALIAEVAEVANSAVDAIDRLNAKIGTLPDVQPEITAIKTAIGKLQDSDHLLDAAGVDVPPGTVKQRKAKAQQS